jgi:hypothetical protein
MNHGMNTRQTKGMNILAKDLPLPQLKEGDRVIWIDPDNFNRCQLGTVQPFEAEGGLRPDSTIPIKTASGGELQALPHELVPLGDRTQVFALNGRSIAPYRLDDPKELAELIWHYGVSARTNKERAIEDAYRDARLRNDHTKGFVLRQACRGDEAIFSAEECAAADEGALFGLIRAHGGTALILAAAEDAAKDWLDDRRMWHDGHLAFNVKVQSIDTPDHLRENAAAVGLNVGHVWERFQEWVYAGWNNDLQNLLAIKRAPLLSAVISEGRSSGWAVPCIAPVSAKEATDRHALTYEGLKDFLKDLKEQSEDPEGGPSLHDFQFTAHEILAIRQFQAVVDETMGSIGAHWAWFLDDEIKQEQAPPDKHLNLRQAATRDAGLPPYTNAPLAVDFREDSLDSSRNELRVIEAGEASRQHPQGPLVVASFNFADRTEGHANAHLFTKGAAMVERLKKDEVLLRKAADHVPAELGREIRRELGDLQALVQDVHPAWRPEEEA